MSWRTVVIVSQAKLEYQLGYLVVRGEQIRRIHLSEIYSLMIQTAAVSMTAVLLQELAQRKIKVVFCDDKHNPIAELSPLYGGTTDSRSVFCQTAWRDEAKRAVWQQIVANKILHQAHVLESVDASAAQRLRGLAAQVELNDCTNREGHAAKLYFNRLFGDGFVRGASDGYNAALNYGYTVLLSAFNREVVAAGYLTQLGIFHHNEYNRFNLSCDLMEPFRGYVDAHVLQSGDAELDTQRKHDLVDLLNRTVRIQGMQTYLTQAIRIYVHSVLDALGGEVCPIAFPDYAV